jgi:hypothetical protein
MVGLWSKIGATERWIPELLPPEERQSIDVLQGLRDRDFPRDPVLLTVLLCRDPATVLTRLKASRAEIARAEGLQRAPAHPASNDPADVRRWLAQVGESARDLVELWRLRHGSWPVWRSLIEVIRGRGDATSIKDLAVSGDDLIQAGITPGPRLGQVLSRLMDRVLEEPRLNSRETLLSMAKELS